MEMLQGFFLTAHMCCHTMPFKHVCCQFPVMAFDVQSERADIRVVYGV